MAMRVLKIYLLFLLFASCSLGNFKSPTYKVALDPTWEAVNLPERSASLRAFSIELMEEIGKIENINVIVYDQSWSDLLPGLEHKDYNGILSNQEPYVFHEKTYDFSSSYLSIGPVLVIPFQKTNTSLDQIKEQEIGVIKGSSGALILQKYPDIIQREYDSIPQALSAVATGTLDGAVIDALNAYSYCHNLYQGKLKIATPPLNQEGLRLMTLHKNSSHLIEAFNKGLTTLKKNGTYARLTQKWNLQD